MKRLRLIKSKPRRSRKSIILTMKYTLDIHSDKSDEIRDMFITWMRDKFSQWDDTILQYFLYDTHTEQNDADDRLELEGHLDKILDEDFENKAIVTMKYVLDIHEDNDEENEPPVKFTLKKPEEESVDTSEEKEEPAFRIPLDFYADESENENGNIKGILSKIFKESKGKSKGKNQQSS